MIVLVACAAADAVSGADGLRFLLLMLVLVLVLVLVLCCCCC